LLALTYLTLSFPAYAALINIYPGNSFETAVESLNPGDTLIVHQGTYSESGRIGITVKGTATSPVVIKGADGETRPVITRPSSATVQNTINFEGATHLTIKGLEIIGNGGDGINLSAGPAYITLEDLVIHDIDVGINFRSSMNNITVNKNHIYNTGIGGGTGEGMYVGCNNATCIVRDSIIENNWIHDDLPGATQGDGIEVKVGSYYVVIRNNVIYNKSYPGIFVYGGGSGINTVEGNAIWNCLEGIYAVSDALVRNNIVLDSGTGISSYSHAQVPVMKDLTIANNTLFNNNDGLYIRWGSGSNITLANNAVYSPGKSAVNANSGLGGAGISIISNYVEGGSNISIDNIKFFSGGSSAGVFADAANKNLWPKPGSILIGKGATSPAPSIDFNESPRIQPYDIGAYETDGRSSNPGWNVGPGFKTSTGIPRDTILPKAPTSLRVQ
jgi:parallel beta-helix repeat protein